METTNYLILGSAVVFGIGGLHLISLAVRNRNLREQLAMLESSASKPAKKVTKKKATKKKSRR
jgi:hypothetical protein